MRIIEIQINELGGHDNQFSSVDIPVPEGWAIIPEDMEIPDTFPFVNITVLDEYVTSMTAGVMPPPGPDPEPEDDVWDDMAGAIREGVNDVD